MNNERLSIGKECLKRQQEYCRLNYVEEEKIVMWYYYIREKRKELIQQNARRRYEWGQRSHFVFSELRTDLTKLNISIFWEFRSLTDLVTLKWDLYDDDNRTYENSIETLNFQASIYKIVHCLMREIGKKTFSCKIYLLADVEFCQLLSIQTVWCS